MGKQKKYTPFHFLAEWLDYSETLTDGEKFAFMQKVMYYGCLGEDLEMQPMTEETKQYFNEVIKPYLTKERAKYGKARK